MNPKDQIARFEALGQLARQTCTGCGVSGPPHEVATPTGRWYHFRTRDGGYTTTPIGFMAECEAAGLYDEMRQIKEAIG